MSKKLYIFLARVLSTGQYQSALNAYIEPETEFDAEHTEVLSSDVLTLAISDIVAREQHRDLTSEEISDPHADIFRAHTNAIQALRYTRALQYLQERFGKELLTPFKNCLLALPEQADLEKQLDYIQSTCQAIIATKLNISPKEAAELLNVARELPELMQKELVVTSSTSKDRDITCRQTNTPLTMPGGEDRDVWKKSFPNLALGALEQPSKPSPYEKGLMKKCGLTIQQLGLLITPLDIETIDAYGRAPSPAARNLPGPSTARDVTVSLVKDGEENPFYEDTVTAVATTTDYKLKKHEDRLAANIRALEELIKAQCQKRVKVYKGLYGLEPQTIVLDYHSLLSPQIQERKKDFTESNLDLVQLKQEAMVKILEKMAANSRYRQSLLGDHADKRVKFLSPNTAVNKNAELSPRDIYNLDFHVKALGIKWRFFPKVYLFFANVFSFLGNLWHSIFTPSTAKAPKAEEDKEGLHQRLLQDEQQEALHPLDQQERTVGHSQNDIHHAAVDDITYILKNAPGIAAEVKEELSALLANIDNNEIKSADITQLATSIQSHASEEVSAEGFNAKRFKQSILRRLYALASIRYIDRVVGQWTALGLNPEEKTQRSQWKDISKFFSNATKAALSLIAGGPGVISLVGCKSARDRTALVLAIRAVLTKSPALVQKPDELLTATIAELNTNRAQYIAHIEQVPAVKTNDIIPGGVVFDGLLINLQKIEKGLKKHVKASCDESRVLEALNIASQKEEERTLMDAPVVLSVGEAFDGRQQGLLHGGRMQPRPVVNDRVGAYAAAGKVPPSVLAKKPGPTGPELDKKPEEEVRHGYT